jgi:hypothetical protein
MYLINLPSHDLKWLQKALNKKDIRNFCNQILVKNGEAYATNGHVLHRVETVEDQDGLYSREGIKLDEESRHPLRNNSYKLLNGYRDVVTLFINRKSLGTLKLSDHTGINHSYFNNAVDKATDIELLSKEDYTSIRIDYGNRTAIIMCCKI